MTLRLHLYFIGNDFITLCKQMTPKVLSRFRHLKQKEAASGLEVQTKLATHTGNYRTGHGVTENH